MRFYALMFIMSKKILCLSFHHSTKQAVTLAVIAYPSPAAAWTAPTDADVPI